jgi:hypothetical protein
MNGERGADPAGTTLARMPEQLRMSFRLDNRSVRNAGVLALLIAAVLAASPVAAQTPDAASRPLPLTQPAEAELNLINLPTTRPLKRHQSYFRLTHRFARDLRRGDFGDLASDLFSLDSGAIIGLEYRFGLTENLQAGVHRSILSKTIEVFGRYDRWPQSDTLPVSISLIGSVEGLDNMTEHHQSAVAATISRTAGSHLVVYTMPAFVWNTAAADVLTGEDHADNTMLLGLGTRLQLRPSVYVTGEYTPRVAGYDPGADTWGAGIEKKVGGHTLQLNFTNSFGTTFGQLARLGREHDVYLGFNITRLF